MHWNCQLSIQGLRLSPCYRDWDLEKIFHLYSNVNWYPIIKIMAELNEKNGRDLVFWPKTAKPVHVNGQESMLGAGHVRRETGGGAHHQPGPACGELLVMEASGLLPGCSNHEAPLTTLSIYPYSSTKFQMAFSFVYIFLDRRSITRSKYATDFTFGIPLNFLLFF